MGNLETWQLVVGLAVIVGVGVVGSWLAHKSKFVRALTGADSLD